MEALLAMFKNTIGDYSGGDDLDDYYTNFLVQAQALLRSEDISETVLSSTLGQFAVVLAAHALMENKDIADNNSLILLRNQLTAETKAERYANDNG